MLPAGVATSHFLEQLIPLLSKGDIVIDGGNAHYKETEKRAKRLDDEGILFLGVGVSGGEEGALKGPSLMVGGDHTAYEIVKEDLFKIAAKNSNKIPCCAYFGTGGAGHFVKMVHNGIEYA
jgi:6-phosphogluconate dehydrogenase